MKKQVSFWSEVKCCNIHLSPFSQYYLITLILSILKFFLLMINYITAIPNNIIQIFIWKSKMSAFV